MRTEQKTLAQLKEEDVDLRNVIHHSRRMGLLRETVRFTILRAKVRNLIWRIEQNILLVAVLVFIAGFATGCIENTVRGAGKMIDGAGQLVSGVGQDIGRATNGYAKEN